MKKYNLSLLIIFSLCYVNSAFGSESICEGSMFIEANSVEEHDKFKLYKGNVIVSKGLLSIEGSHIYKKNTRNNVESLNMEEVTFAIRKKGANIYGSADKVIFHTLSCILDLFGEIEINIDSLVLKYNSPVRFILNSNEISPLLYHIDQRLQIIH